jgi:hypothetical protein
VLLLYQSVAPLSAHLAAQGYDQSTYGGLIAINGVLIVLLQPLVMSRVGGRDRSRVLALGGLLMGGGLALHGAASWLAVHAAAIAIWTLGEIMTATVNSAAVAHLAGASARGRYQGVYGMSWGMGSMLGPLLGSAVLESAGSAALWTSCLAIGLAVALGYLLTAPARRARASPRPERGRGGGDRDFQREAPGHSARCGIGAGALLGEHRQRPRAADAALDGFAQLTAGDRVGGNQQLQARADRCLEQVRVGSHGTHAPDLDRGDAEAGALLVLAQGREHTFDIGPILDHLHHRCPRATHARTSALRRAGEVIDQGVRDGLPRVLRKEAVTR